MWEFGANWCRQTDFAIAKRKRCMLTDKALSVHAFDACAIEENQRQAGQSIKVLFKEVIQLPVSVVHGDYSNVLIANAGRRMGSNRLSAATGLIKYGLNPRFGFRSVYLSLKGAAV